MARYGERTPLTVDVTSPAKLQFHYLTNNAYFLGSR